MALPGKIGVLIVNLGTPDAPTRSAVYRYLKEFLLDKRVIDIPWLNRQLLVRGIIAPFRSKSSAKEYEKLWTEEGSPLKIYGESVAKGVQERLGPDYAVVLGMRYQSPSLETALNELLAQEVREIVVFPMFPQYASASTGSVLEEVMRLLSKELAIPAVRMINSYYFEPAMIKIYADNARKFDLSSYDHVLFSFHGLPERQLEKTNHCGHCLKTENCCDAISTANQFCYSAQCHATSRAIAAELSLSPSDYSTSYQSRLGKEEWKKPYTTDTLERLAKEGKKRLLVFSPAFVADCLETLIEISHEYQELFQELGGEKIDLVPSLNDNPKWIDFIADMVK